MGDLAGLLEHPVRSVRFFALDAILAAATESDGPVVAWAVQCIHDGDSKVRWKTLVFLSRASDAQVRASLPHLESELATIIAWLLDVSETADVSTITDGLEDSRRVARLIAAATAARIARRQRIPRRHAAASPDPDVSTFAKDELERLELKE